MLKFLLCAFVLHTAWHCHAQFWDGLGLHPEDIFNRHYWNWRQQVRPGDVWPPRPLPHNPVTERDREPLAPDTSFGSDDDIEVLAANAAGDAPLPDSGVVEVDAAGGFPPVGFGDAPWFGGVFANMFSRFNNGNVPIARPQSWVQHPNTKARQGWWNGPDVCEKHHETTKGDFNSSYDGNVFNLTTCQITPHKYECTTNVMKGSYVKSHTVTYVCCPGYQRVRGEENCVKVNTKPLLETVQELKGKQFGEIIVNTGLEKKVQEETLTIFMPTDKALDDFTEKMLIMNQVELDVPAARRRRDLSVALSSKDLILNHIVKGIFNIYDTIPDDSINSEYMNSSIRMNIFLRDTGEAIYTANCVPITKMNKLATNGIVHVVDGVIMPGIHPIREIVQEGKDLNILKQILRNPETMKMLERTGPFTFLAPTDEAFQKLSNRTIQKLINGDTCSLEILEHHIIEHTVCESIIEGSTTLPNLQNKNLDFIRSDNNTVSVRGAKLVKSDIVARDGMLHTIDTVIFADLYQPLIKTLEKKKYTKFIELIEEAGLTDELNQLNNGTLFVLDNKDFEQPDVMETLKTLRSDKGKLRDALLYQFMLTESGYEFEGNNRRYTLLDGQKVWFYQQPDFIFKGDSDRASVNCAPVSQYVEKACGFNILRIRKPLVVPTKTLMDVINDEDKYSILRKVITGTEIETILKNETSAVSFLAPTNEVFEKLKKKDLDMILENKAKAMEVMSHHLLTDVLCCSDVSFPTLVFGISTLANEDKLISRTWNKQLTIGNTLVTKCDGVTLNGVLHEVDKVMQLSKQYGGLFFRF